VSQKQDEVYRRSTVCRYRSEACGGRTELIIPLAKVSVTNVFAHDDFSIVPFTI